ncbi:MAG: HDOD domain-containing protein [Deltaproteobacteria bacterium]|nr:HDOD domain-containing protein [Deltaproteobacteria bacterium]
MIEARKETLKGKVADIIKISTIPSIVKKIIDVTEDCHSSVHDLEKVIEHDQSIASRVVGISNAVYYGFPRKITSISQAILILGFEMVKGLAISTAVFKGLSGINKVRIISLWRHSFEAAMASVLIAERSGLVNKDSAFLAGLLHDIGRPIMCQIFGKEYADMASEDSNNLVKLEEDAFGAGHAEVGGWFADKCKLPDDCVNSIHYHHSPEQFRDGKAGVPPLIAIVYLANLVILDGIENRGKYTAISAAHADMLRRVKLNGESLAEIKETVAGLQEKIADYYI